MRIFFFIFYIFFIFSFNTSSNDIISKIEKNWNNTRSMSGTFIQLDTDGNYSEGNFYFLKPYLSKFEYKDKKENIITNETLLRLVDKDGYQIESYSIGNNILKDLLSYNIDIKKEFDVISFLIEEDSYNLWFKSKEGLTNQSLQLFFDKNTLDLKKWEIFDELNNKTVLEFTKIKKNIFISQNLFVVKYKNN